MVNPLRVLGATLRDLFDEFLLLLSCNLLWIVLVGSLIWLAGMLAFAGAPVLGALALLAAVLPGGPLTAGMYVVALRVSEGRATKVSDIVAGMRSYVRPMWLVLLIWTVGFLLLLFNISFYAGIANIFGVALLGLWLYLLLSWFALLIYVPALVILQDRPPLRTVARSGVLLVLGHPIFTLATLVLMLVVLGLSTFLVAPLILFGASLLVLWSLRATRDLITAAERRREQSQMVQQVEPVEERGRKGQVRPK